MSGKWQSDEVERLRAYLKIPSVHPDINYDECLTFLKSQAAELGLSIQIHEFVINKPVVIMTWKGLEPTLPSILLNSHMDVVPVYEEHWKYPPFEAHITDDGFIYARGIQDMKAVGMMHLEAVRRLKNAGIKLKRTVHISFVPDEEIGGLNGMKVFTESKVFKDLNIGFELDESVVNPEPNEIMAFNGERTCRQIKIVCKGDPGHGSLLLSETAGEKIYYIIDKFMRLRAEEKEKLDAGVPIGEVTTVNLTQLEGGIQINVLPESLSVGFDVRLSPHVDHEAFDKMVDSWTKEAGNRVTWSYLVKNPKVNVTPIDETNPFYTALKKAVKAMGIELNCAICPGTTDARYIRMQGIPAINFTPIKNTPILLHAHNEILHINEYKNGIDVMEKVLKAVAAV